MFMRVTSIHLQYNFKMRTLSNNWGKKRKSYIFVLFIIIDFDDCS